MKNNEDALAVLGCLGVIAIFPIVAMLNGWSLSILWGWFVIPVFHLPSLSIGRAIGVAMVVSYLTQSTMAATKKVDNWWEPFPAMLSKPILSVAFGWLIMRCL